MIFKDKNNVVLAISAGLIILAIIIALIATGAEKKRIEKATSTETTETVDSDNNTSSDEEIKLNTPGKYKVTTQTGSLTLRNQPNNKSQTVGSLPKDSTVVVLATYDDWAYIETDDTYGWAALKYLQLIEETAAPKHATGKYIINTESTPLGIRSRPSNDSTRGAEIEKGVEVEILAVVDEWGYVEYEDNHGWLSFQYLKAK